MRELIASPADNPIRSESVPAAIEARQLVKRFGKVIAVNDLNLRIYPGEVVGFLGPNGAGKTTTIRVLMGFIRPTAGEGLVLGGRLWTRPALRQKVGYLPGDFRIDGGMTGWDLLSWFGSLRGGIDRRRVDELAERLHVDLQRKFSELSKGNRQKIGIVQAFMHEPSVLILDEPTSGLDPLIQRAFLELVVEAKQRGAAIFFSSHVLPEVSRVADRVAIIRLGRLVSVSTVDELLDKARHRLELRYASPVDANRFRTVPGVVAVEGSGRNLVVTVDGPVGPAMQVASSLDGLIRVSNAGDELEEIFVSLYGESES
jgi:ABC-2 type transport system ATP-binding protein